MFVFPAVPPSVCVRVSVLTPSELASLIFPLCPATLSIHAFNDVNMHRNASTSVKLSGLQEFRCPLPYKPKKSHLLKLIVIVSSTDATSTENQCSCCLNESALGEYPKTERAAVFVLNCCGRAVSGLPASFATS